MISVVIPAAGLGKRMRADRNKQYLVLQGKPILAYTIDMFHKQRAITEIIVVATADEVDFCERQVVEKYGFTKVKKVIAGGATREHSVYEGLKEVSKEAQYVVIHDGVRPFIRQEMLEVFLEKMMFYDALVMAVPEKNTIARVTNGRIKERLVRDDVWEMQTPQAFKKGLIMKAFDAQKERLAEFTDDASVVSAEGIEVCVFAGEYLNIKITTPEDLLLGDAILELMK